MCQSPATRKANKAARLTNEHDHLLVRNRCSDLKLACVEQQRQRDMQRRERRGPRTEGTCENACAQEDDHSAAVDDALAHPL